MRFLKNKFFRFIITAAAGVGLFFLCPICFDKKIWIGLIAVFFLMLNSQGFIARFRVLTTIARILVGILFIISGFIKANDPIGFSYKLEEYFTVFGEGFSCNQQAVVVSSECPPENVEATVAFQQTKESALKPMWDFFKGLALPMAIFICIFEIIIGFTTLLGVQVKITLRLLFLMIIFFSFLTFYSACCNKVTDCGCFGDAVHLKPWESFWKDMILLFLILFIHAGRNNITPVFNIKIINLLLIAIVIASSWFPIHTYKNLPMIDFRPYAVGKNIPEGMVLPATAVKDSVVMVFIYEKNGKKIELSSQEIKNIDSTYIFKCRIDKVIREGDKPHIHDFSITNLEGSDYTEDILANNENNFMLIAYNLDKYDKSAQGRVNDFYELCKKNNISFICMTASGNDKIAQFKKETNAAYEFYNTDATVLKTMIRSNPGLILLKAGTVKALWHANNIPSFNDVKEQYFNN